MNAGSKESKDKAPQDEHKKKPEVPSPFFPFGVPGTLQTTPSGSAAPSAYSAYQQMWFQKEPDPEVEKLRIEGLNKLGEQLHTQSMKQLELEDKRMDHLADIQKTNDTREHRLNGGSLFVAVAVVAVGVILIFQGRTAEGAGLSAGGLGVVLGYLAGYGQGIKKRTF